MEGRAARGEADVRRAGWAVSTAECPSTGNLVGYTEINYISCLLGQREWICRIKSNSLLKTSKI